MPEQTRDTWKPVRCSFCGGYGVVSDYQGNDFYGAKECRDCLGAGQLWLHEPSGTYAVWPGGPLRGRKVGAA